MRGGIQLKNKNFWQFKAKDTKSGELLLYGDIADQTWYGDEVTPKQFKADLDALGDISDLNVYINSGGGDVFAGQAIYSMLKRHKAYVTVYVDGLAASIASIIAMAGDKLIMPSNSMLMIHNPMSGIWGNANEMRGMADTLDKIRESMLAVYEEKTGMKQEEIITLLDAETWLSAQDALEFGFCNEIEEGKQIAASLSGNFLMLNGVNMDLKKFKNTPKLAFIPKLLSQIGPQEEQDDVIPEDEEETDIGNEKEHMEILKAKLALKCKL